ncbi:hypothetical protein NHJ13051_007206 [Beauveria bassiana]
MEYLEHGDLQKHLAHPLSEQEAKLITAQIIEGLGFMHENDFTHRDLKPGGQGTIGFAAPEALGIIDPGRSYTSAVDMWSLGAVVYKILTGTVPFPNMQKALSYCTRKSGFPSDMLDRYCVTRDGQEFIKALMLPDGWRRLTSSTAAKHPWMTQSDHRSAQI